MKIRTPTPATLIALVALFAALTGDETISRSRTKRVRFQSAGAADQTARSCDQVEAGFAGFFALRALLPAALRSASAFSPGSGPGLKNARHGGDGRIQQLADQV